MRNPRQVKKVLTHTNNILSLFSHEWHEQKSLLTFCQLLEKLLEKLCCDDFQCEVIVRVNKHDNNNWK